MQEDEGEEDRAEDMDAQDSRVRARVAEERETECYARGGSSWEAPHGGAGVCGGIFKPDIVMFNDALPQTFQ